MVALPGARAGRRLRELLHEEAAARAASLRPPRIVTAGALPELLFPPPLPVAPPFVLHTLWARALARLPGRERDRIVPDAPPPHDLRAWTALGRTIQGVRAEIGGAGIDFGGVAERCGEGFLFNDEDRWRALARAWRFVLADLEAMGLTDRDDHRRRVARADSGAPRPQPGSFPETLWLVGVTELPPVVRGVLERAIAAGLSLAAVVHAPSERADDFDELGTLRPHRWLDESATIPSDAIRVAADPAGQADLLVEWLRGLDPPPWPDQVTIGIPDPELVPFIEDRLQVEGVQTRDAAGTPIAESAPFLLLEAVAGFLREGNWDSFASLLRHPGLDPGAGKGVEPPVRIASLDRYHSRHLPLLLPHPDRLPSSGAPGEEGDRATVIRALRFVRDELLSGLAEPRPLSRWPDPLSGLLLRLFGEGERDPRRPSDRPILALCEAALTTFDAMRRLQGEADRTVDGATALALVLGEVRDATLPPSAEAEAVELLGWLELHLDDARHLVITGVNEPSIPASRTSDPFLPHALRARIGLPDNEARLARDLYLLRAILAARPGTLLITGARTGSGDPLRPSRLLLHERGEALARRVLHFTHATTEEGTRGPTSPLPDPAAHEPGRRCPFALPPEPVIRTPAATERLRVTDFRRLIADPYLFALERVLGLEALDDRARELDPPAFGSLLHRVLEAFSRAAHRLAPQEQSDPKALVGLLGELLDGDAARWFGSTPSPAVRIQVELARTRLRAFAAWEAAWRADGWVTRAVEARPVSGGGVLFEVDGLPVHLSGRIDRIDHHPGEGRWVLFDYKTSARARTPEETHRKRAGRAKDAPREWIDLQLPLYRHIVRGVRAIDGGADPGDGTGGALVPQADLERVEMGYILLPGEPGRTGAELADWSPAELLEADERARDVVRTLRAGHFAWDPDTTTIRAGSPLAALAGIGAWHDLDDEEGDDA